MPKKSKSAVDPYFRKNHQDVNRTEHLIKITMEALFKNVQRGKEIGNVIGNNSLLIVEKGRRNGEGFLGDCIVFRVVGRGDQPSPIEDQGV